MEIKPYNKNSKKHPDKQLKQIADSLRSFGWRQPIVTDKNDEIIVGHGRWMAYKKYPEGIKEPWIVKADDLTDEQVKAYRLADNKLNESEWDMGLAIEELKELSPEMFALTGFDIGLVKVGNALESVDDIIIDSERLGVIEVYPPETPKLKEKFYLICDSKEDYDNLKDALKNEKINSGDIIKLL